MIDDRGPVVPAAHEHPLDAAPATRTPIPAHLIHPRRVVTWLVLLPLLTLGAWAAAQPSGLWQQIATVGVAAIGAATLANYVPTVGSHPDLGCEPCAVLAGLSVPVSIAVLAGIGPVVGLLIATAGLVQRLRQPATCPT